MYKKAHLFLLVLLTITGCKPSSQKTAKIEPPVQANEEIQLEEEIPAVKKDDPAARQRQLEWNLKSTVGDYERLGNHNSKWDEPARKTLEAFAQSRSFPPSSTNNSMSMAAEFSKQAVNAGCDDPLVQYLYTRFWIGSHENANKEIAERYKQVAQKFEASAYSDIRKFYGNLRAAQALKSAAGGNNTPPEVHQFRRAAATVLYRIVADKGTPPEEVYDACHDLLAAVENNKGEYEEFYRTMEDDLSKNWPDNPLILLLQGTFYIQYAWAARGSGYANTVAEDSWRLMNERLAKAEESLERSWKLDPTDGRVARQMLSVELGQGRGRRRMELWFNRAMRLNPNDYDSCWQKAYYLEPKWYGSVEEALKFGRQCVASTNWGGRVPLVLVDLHEDMCRFLVEKPDQKKYWKDPEVWADIKSSFEKFFRLYPNETGWRHNYARYAYRCEQWDDLNKLIPLLGNVNYEYFGGKQEFEKMVALAKKRSHSK